MSKEQIAAAAKAEQESSGRESGSSSEEEEESESATVHNEESVELSLIKSRQEAGKKSKASKDKVSTKAPAKSSNGDGAGSDEGAEVTGDMEEPTESIKASNDLKSQMLTTGQIQNEKAMKKSNDSFHKSGKSSKKRGVNEVTTSEYEPTQSQDLRKPKQKAKQVSVKESKSSEGSSSDDDSSFESSEDSEEAKEMALALAASAAALDVDLDAADKESISAQSKEEDLRKPKKSSGQSQKSENQTKSNKSQASQRVKDKQKQGSELGSAIDGTASSQASHQRVKADHGSNIEKQSDVSGGFAAAARSGNSANGSTTSSRRTAKAGKKSGVPETVVELADLVGGQPGGSELDSKAERGTGASGKAPEPGSSDATDSDGPTPDHPGEAEPAAAVENISTKNNNDTKSNQQKCPLTFEESLKNSIEPDNIIEKYTMWKLDGILSASNPDDEASHIFSVSDFFEIQNGYLSKFSFNDRNFFYILGYNLFGQKYTPILIIYEYFTEIGRKPEKLEEVALNNKYLLLRAINSQLVYVHGEFLYYFKIENNDTDQTITYTLCQYSVIDQVETQLESQLDRMDYDEEEEANVYAACAIFGGLSGEKEIGESWEAIKKPLYIITVFSQKDNLEYSIRRADNLQVDLAYEHKQVGRDYRRLELSDATQVSLMVIGKNQHHFGRINSDILTLQILDESNNVTQRMWQIQGYQDETSLKEIIESINILGLNDYFAQHLLMPYFFVQHAYSEDEKVQLDQKVTERSQYKYILDIAQRISAGEPKSNFNPIKQVSDIDSFTFETDKFSGIHSIMMVANNNIIFKQVCITSFRELEPLGKPAELHPMTRAALLLEHGILRNKMEMTPFLKKRNADDAIVVMLWDGINKEFKTDQEKLGDEAYQLYDDICGQKVYDVRRLEYIWGEERPFSIRMACAGQNQPLCLEVFSKATQLFSTKPKFTRTVPILSKFDEEAYLRQNCCESSTKQNEIKPTGATKANSPDKTIRNQSFQWANINENKHLVEILEFEIGWSPASKNSANFIQYLTFTGMKILCLKRPISNRFYPLFEDEEIIGTQFLPEEIDSDESFGIKLPNFGDNDFQFKTDLTLSGYKQYIDEEEIAVLFEVRLKPELKNDLFDNRERQQILRNCIKNMINMKQFQMSDLTHKEEQYEIMQPLELLNGQVMGDFYIQYPRQMQRKLEQNCDDLHTASLVAPYLIHLKETLSSQGLLRQQMEIVQDFFLSNSLNRCFQMNHALSANILIEHYLSSKFEKTADRQSLIMAEINSIIYNKDKFENCARFFDDTENSTESMIKFGDLQESEDLPAWSNSPVELLRVQRNDQCQGAMFGNFNGQAHQQIKEYDSKKKSKQPKRIQVQHFLLNFQPCILAQKIRKYDLYVSKPAEAPTFTDFDLSDILLKTVEKYHHLIERFTTIRSLIDQMYGTSFIVLMIQFWVFFLLYLVPFLLQLFLFQNELELTICMGLCLLTSFFFFITEVNQVVDAGCKQYFSSTVNWFEITMFPLNLGYFAFRFQKMTNMSLQLHHEQANILELSLSSLASFFMIFWGVVKTLYFLRASERFSLLIEVIKQSFLDLIGLIVVFIILLLFFSLCFTLVGADMSMSNYPLIHQFPVYILYSFLNSMRIDLIFPQYSSWSDNMTTQPEVSVVMISLIWLLWVANYVVLAIVFLNMAIATVVQSLDKVLAEAQFKKYVRKCELNREARLFMRMFGLMGRKGYQALVLIAQKDQHDEQTSEWQGVVQEVKTHVERTSRTAGTQLRSKVALIAEALGKQDQRLQQTLKSEISNLNSQLSQIESGVQSIKQHAKVQREELDLATTQNKELRIITRSKNHVTVEELKMFEKRFNANLEPYLEKVKTELDRKIQDSANGFRQQLAECKEVFQRKVETVMTSMDDSQIRMPPMAGLKEQLDEMNIIQIRQGKSQQELLVSTQKTKDDLEDYFDDIKGQLTLLKSKQEARAKEVFNETDQCKLSLDKVEQELQKMLKD